MAWAIMALAPEAVCHAFKAVHFDCLPASVTTMVRPTALAGMPEEGASWPCCQVIAASSANQILIDVDRAMSRASLPSNPHQEGETLPTGSPLLSLSTVTKSRISLSLLILGLLAGCEGGSGKVVGRGISALHKKARRPWELCKGLRLSPAAGATSKPLLDPVTPWSNWCGARGSAPDPQSPKDGHT